MEGVSESEGGYETDSGIPGSSKKLKLSGSKGAAVYQTKFKKAWTEAYPFIHEVRGDKYSFIAQYVSGRSAVGIQIDMTWRGISQKLSINPM